MMWASRQPNSLHRLMRRIGASRPVSALAARTFHHLDRPLLQWSNGRLSVTGAIIGLPVVVLTTTGARSGQPRTVPLVSVSDGDRVILIASSFGRTQHPAWYHNLRAHPEALVSFDGCAGTYVAREAEGDERERYWRQAVELYAGYAAYAERAGGRRIPVMVLEPKNSG